MLGVAARISRARSDPSLALRVAWIGAPQPASMRLSESGPGPTLPTWALRQVDSYLRYTDRDANILGKVAPDPQPTSQERDLLVSARLQFRSMQTTEG
jgi:hypothetical protein